MLINQEHARIFTSPAWSKKYPNGWVWIALWFDDVKLQQLSQMLITVTSTLQLDTSYDYISNNEAIQYFIQHFIEKEIFIDTLALKTEKQGITRTFSLSSFSGETKEIRF